MLFLLLTRSAGALEWVGELERDVFPPEIADMADRQCKRAIAGRVTAVGDVTVACGAACVDAFQGGWFFFCGPEVELRAFGHGPVDVRREAALGFVHTVAVTLAPTDQVRSLHGVVRGPGGQLIHGASVGLTFTKHCHIPGDASESVRRARDARLASTTDAQGRYAFEGVPVGTRVTVLATFREASLTYDVEELEVSMRDGDIQLPDLTLTRPHAVTLTYVLRDEGRGKRSTLVLAHEHDFADFSEGSVERYDSDDRGDLTLIETNQGIQFRGWCRWEQGVGCVDGTGTMVDLGVVPLERPDTTDWQDAREFVAVVEGHTYLLRTREGAVATFRVDRVEER